MELAINLGQKMIKNVKNGVEKKPTVRDFFGPIFTLWDRF
jgi:hypothetical protein